MNIGSLSAACRVRQLMISAILDARFAARQLMISTR
jgi:hypothetical protein